MNEITTLSFRHRPLLTSWTIQEEPSEKIIFTPSHHRHLSRPPKLRKPSCRELLPASANDSLPAIQVHAPKCRCPGAIKTAASTSQLCDAVLAQKIASLTRAAVSSKPKPSLPSKAQPPLKLSQSHSTNVLSTLTRLFSISSLSSSSTSRPKPRSKPKPTLTTKPPSPSRTPPIANKTPCAPVSIPLQASLCLAAANLDIDELARYLLPDSNESVKTKVDVNAPNHLGITPLMAAVRSPVGSVLPRAQAEMVRFLIIACGAGAGSGWDGGGGQGVHVGGGGGRGKGESLLSVACRMGLVEVVRVLVSEAGRVRGGVDVNADAGVDGDGLGRQGGGGGGKGQTALHVAVRADRAECVEVLVREGGADVDAVFDAAVVVNMKGEERGRSSLRGKMKARGRGGGRKQDAGRKMAAPRHPVTALHLSHGSYACTRVLLECGADVGVKDGYGRTPLHWAARGGNVDVVRLLLDAGSDVSVTDGAGVTLLGAVVAALEDGKGNQGHVNVVKLLLQKGADLGETSTTERLANLTEWTQVMEGPVKVDILEE